MYTLVRWTLLFIFININLYLCFINRTYKFSSKKINQGISELVNQSDKQVQFVTPHLKLQAMRVKSERLPLNSLLSISSGVLEIYEPKPCRSS